MAMMPRKSSKARLGSGAGNTATAAVLLLVGVKGSVKVSLGSVAPTASAAVIVQASQ